MHITTLWRSLDVLRTSCFGHKFTLRSLVLLNRIIIVQTIKGQIIHICLPLKLLTIPLLCQVLLHSHLKQTK